MRKFLVLLLVLPHLALAKANKEDTAEYFSDVDKSLTIRKLTFLPTVDNVKGVYARSIDTKLSEIIKNNHRWEYIESHIAGSVVKPEELIGQAKKVRAFSKHFKADAFFTADTRKDPKGLRITLYLFSSRSGQLISEERVQQIQDNTESVLASIDRMAKTIIARIPYDGLVLSRTDNRVTINVGKKDGVRSGQNLPVIKVINVQRHPKRGFIVKSDKALLGQIRVVKADEYLSFADVTSETEAGAITTEAKVTGVTQIQYGNTPWTKTYTPPEQVLSEDNKVVFGKNAREWRPKNPPTFGRVGAGLALGNFDNTLSLSDGTSLNSEVTVYPKINLHGEVWVTPKWYATALIAQGIGSSQNPTGSPSEISNSLSQYRFTFGYNFLLKNEFFGPKLSMEAGFNDYRMFIDGSSSNGFTSLQYRTFVVAVGGLVPVMPDHSWSVGGKVHFHFFSSLKETPVSSGTPNNSINQFSLFAENKLSERLRFNFGLELHLFSTSFSGGGNRTTPASNLSHRFIMATTGIDYLF